MLANQGAIYRVQHPVQMKSFFEDDQHHVIRNLLQVMLQMMVYGSNGTRFNFSICQPVLVESKCGRLVPLWLSASYSVYPRIYTLSESIVGVVGRHRQENIEEVKEKQMPGPTREGNS
jgi:hypothetical protein